MQQRTCRKCNNIFDIVNFYKKEWGRDGYSPYCKPCDIEVAHRSRLITTYGITPEEYLLILAEQNYVCKICKSPPQKNKLAIDHDHATGVIRGLLCSRCNQHLEWSINYNEEIRNYLEKRAI